MSKYKVGDKFIVEIEEIYKGDLVKHEDHLHLHRIKGFNSLVLDEYGLDKLEKVESSANIAFLQAKAYNKGMNDAWELARKIFAMTSNEFDDVFGDVFREDVFCNYTPQEALAKLKTYEEQSKIEVGDVVTDTDGWEYVVINIYKDRDSCRYNGVTSCGKWTGCSEPTKTGKHIDIKSILEQIGE